MNLRIAALIVAAATTVSAAQVAQQATRVKVKRGEPADFILTILHNSDGESQLLGTGPNDDFGNVARFATLADDLRVEAVTNPGDGIDRGVLFISSGDNFLAGPEFSVSLDRGVPFYDSIAIDLIRYDAMTIGNHEFDFGPDVLADFIAGFNNPPTFLSANLDFSAEPALQAFVDSGVLASSKLFNVNGRMVGVIGATTPDLPFISSPRNVEVNPDVLAVVQAEIAALQAAGAKIIILSSHLQNINAELSLVAQLDGLDLVIAGGGGELLANPDDVLVPNDSAAGPYPALATDLSGDSIPVVSTSGDYAYIGRIIMSFDADGRMLSVNDDSGPVRVSGIGDDAVEPDSQVQRLVVDPVADAVADLAANVIALSQVDLEGRRSEVRSVETNLGNLASDALLWEARRRAADFEAPLPTIAFQNGGGIRNDSIIPEGDITELDTFEILPFANFVAIVHDVPPSQLKEILENSVSTQFTGGSTGRFAQIAGLSFVWDPDGTPQEIDLSGNVVVEGTRVRYAFRNDGLPIVFAGQVVDFGIDFDIATIDFLARGGDQYPFRGREFTNIGVSYQQTLVNYIVEHLQGLITPTDAREGGEGRITID